MDDDQQFCLRWNNHQSTLISVFDTLLENGTLVDCTLAAEGKFLKAHKVVLSACSPYFAALLSQQYDKHPIFILKDVKFQELRAMMDYMYRGEVNISQDQLAALLKAAESLQIKGLSDGRGSSVKGTDSGNGALPSALQQPKISHPTVPVVSKPGLTIEHKRPRQQHPAATESDVSLSREGSASPTSRKRKKVRRRSIDTNNLPDNHDQLSNSSSQSMPHHQQQQQQQQQSHTSTVNTPAATLPQITSATSAANVLNVTKKTEPSETKKDVEQSVQLQRDQQRDQNADDDDDDDDDQNEMEPPAQRQKHDDYTDKMDSHSEVLIEPKNEYNDVEDLTLEDEDLIDDDPDQAGPSHGGDGSSHGYAQWQIDRGQDDAFMTTTEATGQHRDAQGSKEVTISMDASILESEHIIVSRHGDNFVLTTADGKKYGGSSATKKSEQPIKRITKECGLFPVQFIKAKSLQIASTTLTPLRKRNSLKVASPSRPNKLADTIVVPTKILTGRIDVKKTPEHHTRKLEIDHPKPIELRRFTEIGNVAPKPERADAKDSDDNEFEEYMELDEIEDYEDEDTSEMYNSNDPDKSQSSINLPKSKQKKFTLVKGGDQSMNECSNSSYQLELGSDASQNEDDDERKPFACRHCGKQYRWKSTMRRHETVECGGKAPSYACPYCEYKAKQRGNLGVHVRKHHPDRPQLASRRKSQRGHF